MFFIDPRKLRLPTPEQALPGRANVMQVPEFHHVLNTKMTPPYPDDAHVAMFGLGCFWGAEKAFWPLDGVFVTAVGYAAGHTPNPTYEEVCSGRTGHNEVVQVIYRPAEISYVSLLKTFWEGHDPTQGMRQGNDVGTQYRSGIYVYDEDQKAAATRSKSMYQEVLKAAGHEDITTEIIDAPTFYFAEDYHQQYLSKNPGGYCGLGGTGVSCPVGLVSASS